MVLLEKCCVARLAASQRNSPAVVRNSSALSNIEETTRWYVQFIWENEERNNTAAVVSATARRQSVALRACLLSSGI